MGSAREVGQVGQVGQVTRVHSAIPLLTLLRGCLPADCAVLKAKGCARRYWLEKLLRDLQCGTRQQQDGSSPSSVTALSLSLSLSLFVSLSVSLFVSLSVSVLSISVCSACNLLSLVIPRSFTAHTLSICCASRAVAARLISLAGTTSDWVIQ